jgi:hypothetical protein
MAYFNHAFRKTFLATGESLTTTVTLLDGTVAPAVTVDGFLTTTGLPTYALNSLSAQAENIFGAFYSGYIGYFNPKTNLSVIPDNCCNVILAGSAIYTNDKIGPFHGGYTETNKSKMINPKYVSRFYTVDPCEPQNEVLHVGSTFWTAGGGVLAAAVVPANDGSGYVLGEVITATTTTGAGIGIVVQISGTGVGGAVTSVTIINPGKGYSDGSGIPPADVITLTGGGDGLAEITVTDVTTANVDPITGSGGVSCCKEFLCGETYSLRIDIKGSPALRYLNHNAYYIADAYTGCCPEGSIAPTPVDSTEVFIKWADAILRYPVVNPFVQIIVQDQTGVLWYAPGTSAADLVALGGDTWDNYVSPGYIDGACAGMILNGAYVDTKFGDCTFQLTDFYEVEPVKLYASEVDLNGDPCTFDGICVVHECLGTQANGLGETIVRDLTLSEAYRQNFLHSDLRIREITQGNQIIASINRNGLYFQSCLQHSVPRFNNPSSTFDNDQYLLQVVATDNTGLSEFNDVTTEWLTACGVCEFDNFTCETECIVPIIFPPLPPRGFRPGPRPGGQL